MIVWMIKEEIMRAVKLMCRRVMSCSCEQS